MDKITDITELNQAIIQLEAKKKLEGYMLKEQFEITYESLKPINLIKSTVNELAATPEFKSDLLNTTLSLAAGYISKKIAIGTTNNPFKQILGTILQMGVTKIIAKNSDDIKSTFKNLIPDFLKKSNS